MKNIKEQCAVKFFQMTILVPITQLGTFIIRLKVFLVEMRGLYRFPPDDANVNLLYECFLFFPQTHVCDIQNPQWLFFAKNPLGNLQNYFCSRDCVSSISNSAKVWKQISKLFWSSLPTLHIFSSAECSVVLIRFSMIENKNGMLVVVVLFRNKRPMLDEMN